MLAASYRWWQVNTNDHMTFAQSLLRIQVMENGPLGISSILLGSETGSRDLV